MEIVGWLLAISFAVMLIYARRGRAALHEDIEKKERDIQALNCENMDLADEVKRYKGVLDAIAPAAGEVWETKITYPVILDEQIEKLVRGAGMRPWGKE